MELRVNGEVGAYQTPTGFIPKYENLAPLFKQVLHQEYTEADYTRQFTLRIPENLRKIDRLTKIYETQVKDTPQILLQILEEQRSRLLQAQSEHGDYVPPDKFPRERRRRQDDVEKER